MFLFIYETHYTKPRKSSLMRRRPARYGVFIAEPRRLTALSGF